MNRKESYKDLDRYRETCRQQRLRYYQKTAGPWAHWTDWEDDLVLKHEKTDHELSQIIGHSVKAIQIRRSRLKKNVSASNA